MKTASIALLVAVLGAGRDLLAQLANPIPAPVAKQGLRVEIKDVARLPDTRGLRPATEDVAPTAWARVNFVRELADGRRFANDTRGRLYLPTRTVSRPCTRTWQPSSRVDSIGACRAGS